MSRSIAPWALVAAAALMFLQPQAWAQSPVADQFGAKVGDLVCSMYPQLETIYKGIHAHPELGFQQTRTAAKRAAEMCALGFALTDKVGTTRVVAMFKNGAGPLDGAEDDCGADAGLGSR